MKQALWLLGAAAVAVLALVLWDGPVRTVTTGYGALSASAALISATFLWLFWVRATPLALGMVLSWAGVAAMAAALAGAGTGSALLALPPVAAGVTLHFGVMRTSMGLGRWATLLPVGAAFLGAMAARTFTNA
jgi:hypothetical protein